MTIVTLTFHAKFSGGVSGVSDKVLLRSSIVIDRVVHACKSG